MIATKPVTSFDALELGNRLHDLVTYESTRKVLIQRNLGGVVARHGGSRQTSLEQVQKAQHLHRAKEVASFALLDHDNEVVGMGSIYPGLKLRRIRLPHVAPAAAEKLGLSQPYDHVGPNITAWRDLLGMSEGGYGFDIQVAYRELRETAKEFVDGSAGPAWTIEPVNQPPIMRDIQEIHLLWAGFEPAEVGRFDDQESRRHAPPLSRLHIERQNPTA